MRSIQGASHRLGGGRSFSLIICLMASDTRPKLNHQGQPREKVILQPGFHLTDWLRLVKSPGADFSGRHGQPPMKITKEELALHNSKHDCWTSYHGKVYNITNYVPYHPGGEAKIMLGAGRDCTALFNKYHAWVNIESMLSKCYVGTLASEKDVILESDETESGSVALPSIDELTIKDEVQRILAKDDDTT